MIKVKTSKTGLWNMDMGLVMNKLMMDTATDAAVIGKNAAQQSFIDQKKATPKMPSLLFSSFGTEGPGFSGASVRVIIYAGGPDAPYAIYVNDGFNTTSKSNKRFINGYKFMEAGGKAVEQASPKIFDTKVSRLM
jgi:hypothetical protein